jgi:hypothetical protein
MQLVNVLCNQRLTVTSTWGVACTGLSVFLWEVVSIAACPSTVLQPLQLLQHLGRGTHPVERGGCERRGLLSSSCDSFVTVPKACMLLAGRKGRDCNGGLF